MKTTNIILNAPESLLLFNHICRLGQYYRDDPDTNPKSIMTRDFFISYLKLFKYFLNQYNDYLTAMETGNINLIDNIEGRFTSMAEEIVTRVRTYYIDYTDDVMMINRLDIDRGRFIEYIVMSLDELRDRLVQSVLAKISNFDYGFANIFCYMGNDDDTISISYANHMVIILELKFK